MVLDHKDQCTMYKEVQKTPTDQTTESTSFTTDIGTMAEKGGKPTSRETDKNF